MKITRVGVDLAKSVFQVHGVDRAGRCVWKRQLKRSGWLKVMSETLEPGCEIGMEACGGAHHWGRELRARGFTVKLISPQFVKPYLKSLKNDVNDAEAICEAMSRHHMRFVAIKTVEQQDIQALHRVREGLKQSRTAKGNQIRGLVAEYGLVAPKQMGSLRKAIPYLRSILIHGARSVVSKAKHKDDRLSQWVTELATRSHPNVAAVALANKTVRIAWAMLRNGADYDPEFTTA